MYISTPRILSFLLRILFALPRILARILTLHIQMLFILIQFQILFTVLKKFLSKLFLNNFKIIVTNNRN